MKITIDGQISTLTPDITEKNLGSFLQNLEFCLETKKRTLTGIKVNDEEATADTLERIFTMNLEEIYSLDLETRSMRELLYEAVRYTHNLVKEAQEKKKKSLSEQWHHSPAARFIQTEDEPLYRYVAESVQDLTTKGEELITVLAQREKELEHPKETLKEYLPRLSEVANQFENTGILFQTGRDQEVAQLIHHFSEIYGNCIRLISYVLSEAEQNVYFFATDTVTFPAFIDELNRFLKDFIQAYAQGDIILAGDLAEYEIVPRLRQFCTTVHEYLVSDERPET